MLKTNESRIRQGFSLIELLVVIFIMGCLLSFTWSAVTKTTWRFNLEKAVWETHSMMNYLKYRALLDNLPYRLKVNFQGYTIEKYDQVNEVWLQAKKVFLSGVNLEATNSPTFYPGGTVSNLATIIISNKTGGYKLSIAITGRIKVIPLTGETD